MNNPLISVIVPVYNVEKYLPCCIDSILAQTFTDFELLLIDDGSKDKSGEICDEYAERDNRIKVFHKENGGVSSARNFGLGKVSGLWVYFSDADDEVDINGLKNLVELISDKTDLIIAGYKIFDENGKIQYNTQLKNVRYYISPYKALIEMYCPKLGYYQGYLWAKLFRMSVICENNHIFNTDIFYNEDRLFIFKYICFSGRLVHFSDRPIYNYYQRANSAMGKLKREYDRKFITDFTAFYLMKKCLLKCPYVSNKLIKLSNRSMFDSYRINLDMMKSSGVPTYELNGIRKMLFNEIGIVNYIFFLFHSYLRRVFFFIRHHIINFQ